MRCFSVSIKSRKLSASPVHAKCIMQSGREMIINYQNEQHGKRERERYATLCIRSSSHAHAAAHMPGCRFRKCLCQCVKSNMYRKHSKKKIAMMIVVGVIVYLDYFFFDTKRLARRAHLPMVCACDLHVCTVQHCAGFGRGVCAAISSVRNIGNVQFRPSIRCR